MKQAIAGVVPADLDEVTMMTVWPSVASFALGRFLGRLYNIQAGFYVFRIGNFIALAATPLALLLYFWRVIPFAGVRYRITNRRVVVQRGLGGRDERWVDLDRFDQIEVQVRPGQEWYHAGDLIFRNGDTETLRLAGVSRPESFRHACLNARNGYVGVQEAIKHQFATA